MNTLYVVQRIESDLFIDRGITHERIFQDFYQSELPYEDVEKCLTALKEHMEASNICKVEFKIINKVKTQFTHSFKRIEDLYKDY